MDFTPFHLISSQLSEHHQLLSESWDPDHFSPQSAWPDFFLLWIPKETDTQGKNRFCQKSPVNLKDPLYLYIYFPSDICFWASSPRRRGSLHSLDYIYLAQMSRHLAELTLTSRVAEMALWAQQLMLHTQSAAGKCDTVHHVLSEHLYHLPSERITASVSWAKSNYLVTEKGGQSRGRKARDKMSSFLAYVSQSFKTRKNTQWKYSSSQIQSACARLQLCHFLLPLSLRCCFSILGQPEQNNYELLGLNYKDVFARGAGD